METIVTAGFALTGSYCTFEKIFPEIQRLLDADFDIIPIMSENCASTDTRFGKAADFMNKFEEMTGKKVISTINEAEPIGPKGLLDILIVAPCTGNTISKIANGVTDTCVTMAVKGHLRNNRPVVIGVSTNDGLGNCAKNIGILLNSKNIYFVPLTQDDPYNKEKSLIAKMDKILPTVEEALNGNQIQPVLT